ncbi:hypothetical protein Tco_1048547 [Tanacetum coccineum]
MSQATSLLPIRSKGELVPQDKKVDISTSNVKIDTEEHFTKPIHQLLLVTLKTHIIFNPLTLTATVLEMYMQQFWHMSENEATKKCHFQLDNQWFEIGSNLLRTM